ncbi:MAG: hypothetical protein J6M43_07785 [Neisseriaceae bacterium]|nr:hypothetical protein [Neisseriaceae bacterium]
MQKIMVVVCVVIGWFFAEVFINLMIEREKKQPHQLSWKMSILIILIVLTIFGLLFYFQAA